MNGHGIQEAGKSSACCSSSGETKPTSNPKSDEQIKQEVSEYYTKVLQKTSDLKTNACCTDTVMPTEVKKALAKIHDEVLIKYYGCGLIMPELLSGMKILDLGCGAGRDCYVLSQFVGENGQVVGVDMTMEQIEVAKKHVDYHQKQFGYSKPNTEFKLGYIEKLSQLGIQPESFDIIVSNCVVNLSPDKKAVLEEAYRALKYGGEMYFSDVYALNRVSEDLRNDPVLFGECLSGALYYNDFLRLAREVGFTDPRLVKDSLITVDNPEAEAKIGHITFVSATYRLFKLRGLETLCEDYGQGVVYLGTIPGHPHSFDLDSHHHMETGKLFLVCGNTYRMLHDTRFSPHFQFHGSFERHFGVFKDCGVDVPFASVKQGISCGSSTSGGGSCAKGACC